MHSTVLVVDDDQSNREVLRAVLEDAQYDIRDVGDGDAALAALRASPLRLVVVLDLVLSGETSGLDILRAVANDAQLAQRHAFVILTASPRLITPDVARLMSDMQAPLVTKPFDMDALLNEVAHASTRVHSPAR